MSTVKELKERYEKLSQGSSGAAPLDGEGAVPALVLTNLSSAQTQRRTDSKVALAKVEPPSPRGSMSERRDRLSQRRKSFGKSQSLGVISPVESLLDRPREKGSDEEGSSVRSERAASWEDEKAALLSQHERELREQRQEYESRSVMQTLRMAGSAWMTKAFGNAQPRRPSFFRSARPGQSTTNVFHAGDVDVDAVLAAAEDELKQLYSDSYDAALMGVRALLPALLQGEDADGIRQHIRRTVTEQGLRAMEEECLLLRDDAEAADEEGGKEVASPAVAAAAVAVAAVDFTPVEAAPVPSDEPVTVDLDLDDWPASLERVEAAAGPLVVRGGQLGLADEHLTELMAAVEGRPVAELDLAGNDFTEEAFGSLGAAVGKGDVLASLSLRWCMLGEMGASALSGPLGRCSGLRALQLEGAQMGAEGAEALFPALRACAQLQDLNVADNFFEDAGAIALADGLRNHPTLVTLNASSNGIGEDGVRAISAMLKGNSVLRLLILNDNQMYDEGASALGEAFALNRSLTSVEVKSNSICTDGVLDLVRGLEHNSSIVELDLTLNDPGIAGEIALFDLGRQRPTVEVVWKEMGVGANYSDDEVREIIEHIGVVKITRKLLHGRALDPLIADEDLIPQLRLPDRVTADQFFDAVLSGEAGFLRNGTAIVRGIASALSPEEAAADPLLTALLARLPALLGILRAVQPGGECMALGERVLPILALLDRCLRHDAAMFEAALLDAGLCDVVGHFLRGLPNCNELHHPVVHIIKHALRAPSRAAALQLLAPGGVVAALFDDVRAAFALPYGRHGAHIGHALVVLAEVAEVGEELPDVAEAAAAAIPGWAEWAADDLPAILRAQVEWESCEAPERTQVEFVPAEEMAKRELAGEVG